MASSADTITLQGKVTDVFPGTKFEVTLENGHKVTCTLSGKLKMNQIRVLKDDTVDVEVSAYDLMKGRIIWRYK